MVSSCGLVPRDRHSTLGKILAGIRRTAARVKCIAMPHIQNWRRRRLLALNTCRRVLVADWIRWLLKPQGS